MPDFGLPRTHRRVLSRSFEHGAESHLARRRFGPHGQAPTAATDEAPEPEGPPDRAARRQRIVLATVVAVLLAGAALAIYFKMTGDPRGTRGGAAAELRELNLSVTQTGRVLAYRDRVGGFSSVDELDRIPGFPTEFLGDLKRRLTV